MTKVAFLERIYVATPCLTDSQRAFNDHLVELFKGYAIELVCPVHPWGEWARSAMASVAKSKVMLAICQGEQLDSWTALLTGYAIARHVPVVGVFQPGTSPELVSLFDRVVYVPDDHNHLAGPLVNAINLYL